MSSPEQPSAARAPRGGPPRGTVIAAIAAAGLTAGLLAIAQLKVTRPMLLADRFWPGSGAVEIAALALYAAWLAHALADPRRVAAVRRRSWQLFSVVFFAQLVVGLAGLEQALMTGKLHLPVPAMILAGPLYRGAPSFMVWLLAGTLLLVGPAWCSQLCYLGAWDDAFARRRKRPAPLPRWRWMVQLGLLVGIAGVALALNRLGASSALATGLGLGVGVAGVGVMAWWSRRSGAMVHCVVFCPIGLITTTLGRISPFRLRIDARCDGCGACQRTCRYDALNDDDIARRQPARSCTLCGDCLRSCPHGALRFWLPGLGPDAARLVFVALVVALHAATLGLARI